MKIQLLTTGLLAMTLLTGCDPLMAERLLSGALGTGVPSSQPSAIPSVQPTEYPTPRPSGNGDMPTRPETTPQPGASAGELAPSPLPLIPQDEDLLLFLDMETAPDAYVYQGAAVEQKGVSSSREGRVGNAWHFDGQGSFLKIPLDINPEKRPRLTMTAWARYEGPAGSGGPYQVISHDDGGYDRSMGIDTRSTEGIGWSAFVGNAAVLGAEPVVNGRWVFLAVVYDQPAKTVTYYINGARKFVENAELGGGHPFLYLGSNPSYGEHFTGLIDEVRIYGRTLDASEIKRIGELAPPEPIPGPAPSSSPDQPAVKFFDNGNIFAVFNGAPCAPTFTTSQDYFLTEIYNYHWNDAQGQAPPGQIGLKSTTGVVYGPWEVSTRPGQGGVPHAYWVVNPKILLPAGTYTVTDSHPQSWSYNAASGCSMSWLTGIPR